MLTCEHCRDALLDWVFGLLEENESRELQAHVDVCAACQAELVRVRSEQKLMARAARAITNIPEFSLPTGEPAVIANAPSPVAPTPETTIVPAVKRAGRGHWFRTWVIWGAAAAVVLAILAPVVWYRNTVQGYHNDIVAARQAYQKIDEDLAALPAKYEPLHQHAIEQVRAKANPYLHVVGPKILQPHGKAHLDITTRHPEGHLIACDLTVKLLDGKNVVKIARHPSDGHAQLEIDASAARPDSALTLLVEAETTSAVARFQENLRVDGAAYVARIDTNKRIYQTQDVVFVRGLILDRVTLQPPANPIPVRVALLRDGQPIRALELKTGAGGIVTAEFAVEETFAEDTYAIDISSIDASRFNVHATSVPIQIVRELPGIRLDQNRYPPGAVVTGDLMIRGNQPVPQSVVGQLDGKPLPITLQPQAPGIPGQAGGGMGGNFGTAKGGVNAKGGEEVARLFRFKTAPLPTTPSPGAMQMRLSVPLPSNEQKQAIDALVLLEPTEFAVDFYPEGGDLVAGVKNRVFYRVRSRTGRPVVGEGQVILLTGKNDVIDSSYQMGLGYLDFTPDPRERYTVRVTTPTKVETLGIHDENAASLVGSAGWFAGPFARLGIRREGVVMQVTDPADDHAPRAVGVQGAPIRVTLRRQGPPAKVLLVAHCRGQVVDQRWVDVKREPIDLCLHPTPDIHGMIRVTAYELVADALTPIAERLVYRRPTQRLDFTFVPKGPKLQPGKSNVANVGASDEAGKAAPAWLLASIVDERFQGTSPSLSAHFLLLNEIRGGNDLEQAQIVLHDSPDATEVLERFLGTQGWRRYVAAPANGPVQPVVPLVFSQANVNFELLQKQYQGKIATALTPIRLAALETQMQLTTERERRGSAVNILVGQLHAFETKARLAVGVALGLVLVSLLIASLGLMGVGVYRVVRGHRQATAQFGSAFACVLACVGIYLGGHYLAPGTGAGATLTGLALKHEAGQERERLEQRLAQAPEVRRLTETVPAGAFSVRAEQQFAEQRDDAVKADRKADTVQRKDIARAIEAEMVINMTRERGEGSSFAQRRGQDANESLRAWYNRSLAMPGAAPPAEKPAPAKGKEALAKKAMEGAMADRQLEYPYQPSQASANDTLLWHPNLFLRDGTAEVRFEIPAGQAITYRVLLLGHDASGRFGIFETRIDVPATAGR